jgi:hypothetical protein
MNAARGLTAAIVLLLPFAANGADTLGRLFFTPEQRAQLDALRVRKVVATQVKDEPPPEVVMYGGIVRRNDGRTTVWVNNKALSEKDIREAGSLVGRVQRDGRITVQSSAQNAAAPALQLKVGQSAELQSGRVREPFSPIAGSAPGTAAAPKPAAASEDRENPDKPLAQPSSAALLLEASKISPSDPEAAAKLKALANAAR